jgi:predicted nucleic acid-binding protein
LDVLQKREQFYEASARLLASVEIGKVRGLVAAHSITTLFYLIRKDRSVADARATITNLLQFIEIAPIDQSTITQALNLDYRDFEDAVQIISAVQCKVDYLITRNDKDYRPALLPILQPVDFLGTL